MVRRKHHNAYVLELSKDFLYEGKFKKCNPDCITGEPCVYIGMTGLDPDVRFDKRKAGIQSSRYAKQYGLREAEFGVCRRKCTSIHEFAFYLQSCLKKT